MNSSPSFSLNAADLKEIGLGFIALVGACFFAFLLSIVTQINFGPYTALIVLLITPILHAGIKWIKDNDTGLPGEELIDALPGKTHPAD